MLMGNHKKKASPTKTNAESKTEGSKDGDLVYVDVKYVAVGVADTGIGLSKELLHISEAGLFNSDGSEVNSGAKNSGFGLHLAHQLAGTLDSEVNLTNLESFRKFCNVDMGSILNSDSSSVCDSSDAGSISSDDIPGRGTVLYITIPVISDGNRGVSMLNAATCAGHELSVAKKYVFSPKPAPTSADGCFRMLIADDVTMLRKGLVRSVLEIFQQSNCPISVSTACTSEDALRAIGSNTYDMIICDNQFGPPTHLNRLPPDREKSRYKIDSGESKGNIRNAVAQYFKTESFTIAPGDGTLSGLDALLQLRQNTKPSNSIPILVIHSGHQLQLPPQLGIIVVPKPWKRDDFVPLFERSAEDMIESGMCVEFKQGNDVVVQNHGGAQLFIKQDCMEITNDPEEDDRRDQDKDSTPKVRKRTSPDSKEGNKKMATIISKMASTELSSRQLKKQKSNKNTQPTGDHGYKLMHYG